MTRNIHVFDVDGVLADSWQPVLLSVKEQFGLQFTYEQLDHFSALYDLVKVILGDTAGRQADNLWYESQILRSAPIVTGADTAVRTYLDQGAACYACTSRLAKNTLATYEWFEEYLPFFPRENIFIRTEAEEKSVSGNEFKKLTALRVEATHQYDDAIAPLQLTRSAMTNTLCSYLINQPWNFNDKTTDMIERIDSVFTLID